ncbi:MAG: class I SAM-dependent methyltransferase [Deltaproteobacteria bacterium]|nr:class I SAM-dependent methyltransferase [Deltaproteobacteria bacterium]
MTEPLFRRESLLEIIAHVERCLAQRAPIAFAVLDPDRGRGRYAGELVDDHVHRPWRTWVDLAERLGLRLLTPRVEAPLVHLRFEPLVRTRTTTAGTEKYGTGSEFARISKLEDPGFVLDVADALARAKLGPTPRILDLGVNTGDELALLARHAPGATLVGIDHSASALVVARTRFPAATLIEASLAELGALELGRFDLVISIDTLQSPGIDDREVLRRVVQDHLTRTGAVIIGFPNCRYVDGEIEYGTRMKNFRQPELGLLVKDIAFYRKYLQQHQRQVFVTGKHDVLVTGVYAAGGDGAT